MSEDRFYGKLQAWNFRGFSFITRADNGPNLFCHASALVDVPADTGCYGIRVSFAIDRREDGKLFAKDVRRE